MSYKVSNKVFLFIQGILLAILTFKSLANRMLDRAKKSIVKVTLSKSERARRFKRQKYEKTVHVLVFPVCDVGCRCWM